MDLDTEYKNVQVGQAHTMQETNSEVGNILGVEFAVETPKEQNPTQVKCPIIKSVQLSNM
jgi:hypothetical protein